MNKRALAMGFAAAVLAIGGCSNDGGSGNGTAQTPEAKQVAGTKTIAAGLAQNSRFMAAAKAAGLDQTLSGPGPYTVLVPEDRAFDAAPAGTFDAAPENRARVTGVLTNLILPGTVLAEDIRKAIQTGNGRAVLATMGGGTVTATLEGENIVLTDAAGGKGTITRADEQFSNGVVHRLSALLMPSAEQAGTGPAVGDAAGNATGNATGQ